MIFSEIARRVRDALGFAQGSPSSRRPGVDAAGKPLLQKADERYAILAQQQAEHAGDASPAPPNAGAHAPRGLLVLALATGGAAVLLVAGWWLWPREGRSVAGCEAASARGGCVSDLYSDARNCRHPPCRR
ncbi:MAG: hypothetical protein IPK16_15235 [Anaerolineales bacterium]|nr:hypothetical protein [Anaerolineales bacterium]